MREEPEFQFGSARGLLHAWRIFPFPGSDVLGVWAGAHVKFFLQTWPRLEAASVRVCQLGMKTKQSSMMHKLVPNQSHGTKQNQFNAVSGSWGASAVLLPLYSNSH